MTSTTDRNDLMPPQVKELEWVTPKISLMVAEDTESKTKSWGPAELMSPANIQPNMWGPS